MPHPLRVPALAISKSPLFDPGRGFNRVVGAITSAKAAKGSLPTWISRMPSQPLPVRSGCSVAPEDGGGCGASSLSHCMCTKVVGYRLATSIT